MQSEFQEGEGLKDEKKKTMKRQVGPLTWLAITIIFKELCGKFFFAGKFVLSKPDIGLEILVN